MQKRLQCEPACRDVVPRMISPRLVVFSSRVQSAPLVVWNFGNSPSVLTRDFSSDFAVDRAPSISFRRAPSTCFPIALDNFPTCFPTCFQTRYCFPISLGRRPQIRRWSRTICGTRPPSGSRCRERPTTPASMVAVR